ncbi:sodium/calcium exchanger protein, partial [Sphingomonas yabuuchiae]|uniref:sodium/calcium exchanger protein n=1 Tax=Sphingomonas yabuuchiae TaxID=172044 RepID=UPI003615E3EF
MNREMTAPETKAQSEQPAIFRKFLFWLAVATAATVPALVLRYTGARPDPVIDAAIFGVAILAAGFMLSWGAESAEGQISSGLILAAVALITVLPEYAVDLYYAWRAGQDPGSNYVHYAAANMTGANRLLVGIGWPLLVLLNWIRTRDRAIGLAPVNGTEIAFLLLPTIYAFVILLRDRISIFDAAVLIAMFGLYVWRVSRLPEVEDQDEDDEPGLAAAIEQLPAGRQWALMGALTVVAATVIFLSAEPFAEAMVDRGGCSDRRVPSDPVAGSSGERSTGGHRRNDRSARPSGFDRRTGAIRRSDAFSATSWSRSSAINAASAICCA